MAWKVNFRVFRFKQDGSPPRYDTFSVEIKPDESVLDGIERIWAFQDRTLTFRHACHHAGCGSCAMRVNGVEKLTCVTWIKDVTADGGTITVEPLRNFPLIGDLVVDVAPMFARLQAIDFPVLCESQPLGEPLEFSRFEDCLECGACLSACPVMAAGDDYLGPVTLAAIECMVAEPRGHDVNYLLHLADQANGCWRCDTAYECSEVCPYEVNPAQAIMRLRWKLIVEKLKRLVGQSSLYQQSSPKE
jgi:succinate dehydrogenase / fumarate reductase iron-sulfur subunit